MHRTSPVLRTIHDGKVADSQEVALESCIDDRDEGKVSGWRGGRFIVETHDAREVRTIRFAFDPLNPAKRIEEVGSEPDYHTPPL